MKFISITTRSQEAKPKNSHLNNSHGLVICCTQLILRLLIGWMTQTRSTRQLSQSQRNFRMYMIRWNTRTSKLITQLLHWPKCRRLRSHCTTLWNKILTTSIISITIWDNTLRKRMRSILRSLFLPWRRETFMIMSSWTRWMSSTSEETCHRRQGKQGLTRRRELTDLERGRLQRLWWESNLELARWSSTISLYFRVSSCRLREQGFSCHLWSRITLVSWTSR